ncbi:MAG: peptidoglycan editing factor PgeF [Alphaproteobacteria bacterium]
MEKTSILQDFDPPRIQVEGFTHGAVRHGFFGRRGGVSAGLYKDLNCGQGSNDVAGALIQNRARVAEALGIEASNLLSLYQVHGHECIRVEKPWPAEYRPQADAMITDRPGIGLGILSADCAPVLFTAEKIIAAAHAGWKGALNGVLENTVEAFSDYGIRPHQVSACIGPCIGRCSYEVSMEFVGHFLNQDPLNERFFKESRNSGHYMFDLPGYCAVRLQAAGLIHVYMTDADTYANEADFFSYRRATHNNEPDYGRQVSVIAWR